MIECKHCGGTGKAVNEHAIISSPDGRCPCCKGLGVVQTTGNNNNLAR
ncbi:MAG TPA: hypothetical protein PLD55_04385 [bacterium]|nr:hypothetical protein [bacterium]